MANDNRFIIRIRGLRQPSGMDKGQRIEYALRRARKQKIKWVEPEDAHAIFNLHFSVKSFGRQSFHAEATLELPADDGFQYASITYGSKTKESALLGVIYQIENSFWFKFMKARKVYFKVTGAGMEQLYRGYL